MSFANSIIMWYQLHKRDLPWRNTRNPYEIWLSEIILQQTRVEQGMPYYYRFLENYPDIFHLAKAPLQDVLKLWQGLGYYSRARNLHETAIQIVNRYNGHFPDHYEALITLKGIGAYTAAAIASLAFNQSCPVIDGNVIRFISRYLSLSAPTNSPALKEQIHSFLRQEIDPSAPGIFNQALMEIGSLVCKPRNPECTQCPVAAGCSAFRNNTREQFPVKIPREKVKNRYFTYLILRNAGNETLLRKRTATDIWKGLYDFPLIETSTPPDPGSKEFPEILHAFLNTHTLHIRSIHGPYLHLLSHQKIHCIGVQIDCTFEQSFPEKDTFTRIPFEKIHEYPVSRLVEKILTDL